MDNRVVQVPVTLLLDPEITPASKVVWMAVQLYPSANPGELEARTGLTRHTVLKGRRHAAELSRPLGGPRVKVPAALLAEASVGTQAKVLYGLLQVTPGFHGQSGHFSYASLRSLSHLSRNTLKQAVTELLTARWIQITEAGRAAPLHFKLGTPEQRRSQAEVAIAKRRLKRAKFRGEAIMQEYLSLLIDSDQFTDNARPGFLVNPLTKERLELDRFYPPNVAFEFHGHQHDHATERYSQEEVDAQQLRDYVKAGICLYRDIRLVIIRAKDLSLQGMTEKIGQSLPLRNLAGHELLTDFLEETSLRYRATAEAVNRSRR